MHQFPLLNFFSTFVEKFKEVKTHSAAFKSFIPRMSRTEPEQQRGPGPSQSTDQRRAQKTSVMTRAPPPSAVRGQKGHGSKGDRKDLMEEIQTRHSQ